MTFRLALATLLVLVLCLTACGGSRENDEEVTKPVREFFTAFEELDAEGAANVVCKKDREDVKAGLELLFGFVAAGGEDSKIEIVDLKLEATETQENQARVTATSGAIRVSFKGDVQENDITGASGVKVIKEDGVWVICDDSLVESFGP